MTSKRFYWTTAGAWVLLALAWPALCYFAAPPRWVAALGGFAVGWLAALSAVALAILRAERRAERRKGSSPS